MSFVAQAEILATVMSVVFVILAARNHLMCWPFGFIGSALFFYVTISSKLWADALLQIFYMVMAVVGWISWKKIRSEGFSFYTLRLKSHIIIIVTGIFVAIAVGKASEHYHGAFPYIDGATTSFSIIATFLQSRKYLNNWLYWIAIDITGAWIYVQKELLWFASLFVLYTIISIYGWLQWRRHTPQIPSRS